MGKDALYLEKLRQTNLVDYCRSIGLTVVKDGLHEWTTQEHDSLKISMREPWKYRWYSREGNKLWQGTAIDFVMIYHGYDFEQAKAVLEAFTGLSNDKYDLVTEKPLNDAFGRSETAFNDLADVKWNSDCKRAIAYLTKTRGIDYQLVIECVRKGLIREDAGYHNCWFIIKDPDGRITGAEIRGTLTGKKYKQTIGGGGYGFNLKYGADIQAIGFFESAIDLLSYMQLNKIGNTNLNSTLLVSGGGGRTVDVAKGYMQLYPDAKYYSMTDTDEAGERFAKQIGARHIKPSEPFKDWNEELLKTKENP